MRKRLIATAALAIAAPMALAVESNDNAALRYWRAWSLLDGDLRMSISGISGAWKDDVAWAEGLNDRLREMLEDPDDTTVRTILRATRLESCDFAPDLEEDGIFAILPHLGPMRVTARLLAIDAQLAHEAGDIDQAVDRYAAGYRVAEHAAQGRALISKLVARAVFLYIDERVEKLAQSGQLTDDHRAILREALSRFDPEDPAGLLDGIEGERIFGMDLARVQIPEYYERGQLDELLELTMTDDRAYAEATIGELIDSGAYEQEIKGLQRFYDDVLDAWEKPDGQARMSELDLGASRGEYGWITRFTAPALGRIHTQWIESREHYAEALQRLQ